MKEIKSILSNRSGMALLLVMFVISFLVALTVQLGSSVNWQLQAAKKQSDSVKIDNILLSGLTLAQAALYADGEENKFDTLHDEWATLSDGSLLALFPDTKSSIKVQDLTGRIQVNALISDKKAQKDRDKQEKLQQELWYRFLTSGDFAIESSKDALELIDALSDWIDKDDTARDNGAESSHYRGGEKSYECRNGPFLYLEELLLVKGMTREILYGNTEQPGIIEYLTVYGREGKININSAPPQILQALDEDITPELAEILNEFRKDIDNRDLLEQSDWYRRVGGFPGYIKIRKWLRRVSAEYFQVKVRTEYNGILKTGEGLIYRKTDQSQLLLSWAME